MNRTERAVLASVRAAEPSKAVDIGHRCSLPHESLYVALVALEARGLIRLTVDNNNRNKRQALWETA
jgi:hypothetical protein